MKRRRPLAAAKPRKLRTPSVVAERSYTPRRAIPITRGTTNEESARNVGEAVTSAETAAARLIVAAEHGGPFASEIDLPGLLDVMRRQSAAVQGSDLKQLESMLVSQTTALQSLFVKFSERAMTCTEVAGFEVNMRFALRCQASVRANIEAISAIKNPPVVYAKQANFSNGPQQVNNCTRTPLAVPEPNKQLTVTDEGREWLDRGTKAVAVAADTQMEAVGSVHGSENRAR